MVFAPQEMRPVAPSTPTVAPSTSGSGFGLRDPVFWLLVAGGAWLLLWGLGNRCLWQDEAETVLLAKAIVRTGLPIAYDGTNYITQTQGREYDSHYLWHWSPWLQNYVAAGALVLLGDSNLAVRLPFVLAAWLTIPLTYWLALELFGSLRLARLSGLLLSLAVPFLLEARQARSYALVYPCVPLLLLSLHRLGSGRRGGMLGLVATATVLFYAHDFLAVGLLISMVAVALLCHPRWRFVRRLGLALALVAVLTLPGVIYFVLTNQGLGQEHLASWERFSFLFRFYGFSYVTYLIPAPITVALVYLLLRKGSIRELQGDGRRLTAGLLGLTVLFSLYLCLAPLQSFRYQSVLLPVAALLTALVVSWLWQRRAWVGAALVLLLVGTNALQHFPVYDLQVRARPARPHVSPDYVSSPVTQLIGEITHPPEDPAWVVARYLHTHAQPGDVVVTTYDDLPLQFYTGLRVLGGLQGPQPGPALPSCPDWIWIRNGVVNTLPGGDGDLRNALVSWWNRRAGARPATGPAGHSSPGVWAAVVDGWPDASRYQAVFLPQKDLFLSNNPDPPFHLFRSPPHAPPIILLHRIQS